MEEWFDVVEDVDAQQRWRAEAINHLTPGQFIPGLTVLTSKTTGRTRVAWIVVMPEQNTAQLFEVIFDKEV